MASPKGRKDGGGLANIVEPGPLTIKSFIEVFWLKEKLDLAELARLRRVEKWTIESLARHFGLGTTAIKEWLSKAKKSPGLAGLTKRPSNIRGRC